VFAVALIWRVLMSVLVDQQQVGCRLKLTWRRRCCWCCTVAACLLLGLVQVGLGLSNEGDRGTHVGTLALVHHN
jgi:hypothetical protein